jgi:hypothetical protein
MWCRDHDNRKDPNIYITALTIFQIVHEIQFMSEGKTMAFVRYG